MSRQEAIARQFGAGPNEIGPGASLAPENSDPTQSLADYLGENKIVVYQERVDNDVDRYAFYEWTNPGDEPLADVSFDLSTQQMLHLGVNVSDSSGGLKVFDVAERLVKPFSELLLGTSGNFNATEFDPIHVVVNQIIDGYPAEAPPA